MRRRRIALFMANFWETVKTLQRGRIDLEELERLHTDMLGESVADTSYLVLVVTSCAIATFGLLSNSAAVIIGAMIIAPLMSPIRALAFGALEGNLLLVRRAAASVLLGTLLALAIAWLLGRVVGITSFGSEVLARSSPNLLDLGVAVAAGGVSGYAKINPKVSASLPGTAIAVALMPPVCVIGLGLSQGDWGLSQGATLLYVTNLLGITLSCMLTFLLAGYAPIEQAQKALLWAFMFTGLLLIPLGISFVQMVQQNQLEAALKRALLTRTVTFQRVQLVDSEINWYVQPPEVRLTVRSREPVTPRQVKLLEEFVSRELGRPMTLIVSVSQVEEVRREL